MLKIEAAPRYRGAVNLKEGFYQGGVSISEVSLSMYLYFIVSQERLHRKNDGNGLRQMVCCEAQIYVI